MSAVQQASGICAICLVDNNLDSIEVCKLKYPETSHIFHRDCIERWVAQKEREMQIPRCPLCQRKIVRIGENLQSLPEKTAESLLASYVCFYPSDIAMREQLTRHSKIECLEEAAAQGRQEVFDWIRGIEDLTPYELTRILRSASQNDRSQIVQDLLRRYDIHSLDYAGMSIAIHDAAMRGSVGIVRALLPFFCTNDSQWRKGLAIMARERGYREVANLLDPPALFRHCALV